MSNPSEILCSASALRTRSEEFAGALTHGIGLVLSLTGAFILVAAAKTNDSVLITLGCSFYGATLVAAYGASTMSHMYVLASALRTRSEEFAGALTHGIGLVLSLTGAFILVAAAKTNDSVLITLGCSFYGATLVAAYGASTMSHMYVFQNINRLLRGLDQGIIYLLIAGTLTPFALQYLRTPGWICFYLVILLIAFTGFLSKVMFAHRLDRVSVGLYVVLGWSEGIAIMPMLGRIPTLSLYWIIVGGFLYSLGTVFLVLDVRRYQFHAIWHLFVMAGSASHFLAVMALVGPEHSH